MDDIGLSSFFSHLELLGQIIEATDFKFEVRSYLWGHMEAATASRDTKMTIPGNMHLYPSATEVDCIKSELKYDLKGQWGCFEIAVASEAS